MSISLSDRNDCKEHRCIYLVWVFQCNHHSWFQERTCKEGSKRVKESKRRQRQKGNCKSKGRGKGKKGKTFCSLQWIPAKKKIFPRKYCFLWRVYTFSHAEKYSKQGLPSWDPTCSLITDQTCAQTSFLATLFQLPLLIFSLLCHFLPFTSFSLHSCLAAFLHPNPFPPAARSIEDLPSHPTTTLGWTCHTPYWPQLTVFLSYLLIF